MKVVLSDRAIEAVKNARHAVQRAFEKQLRFLAADLHYRSLRAKKYNESQDLWQARVTNAGASISKSLMTPTALKM